MNALLSATSLTDAQLVAIMLVTYFAVYPVLCRMHSTQPRSEDRPELMPFLTWLMFNRVMLSFVALVAAFLWTWVR